MTIRPELSAMIDAERDTVLLHTCHLQYLNPTMKADYELREWVKILWELLAVAAMLGTPFVLICISGSGK